MKVKWKYFLPKQKNHSHDRPQLHDDQKHFRKIFIRKVQKLVHQNHMTRTADWEPFCNSFYNSKDNCHKNIKNFHILLPLYLSVQILPKSF